MRRYLPLAALVAVALCSPLPPTPHVLCHRGSRSMCVENTAECFRSLAAMGCVDLELDVQLSADNELIVFHDQYTTKRTTVRPDCHCLHI